jgi:two-component system nitrogen regulation response regulator GlnG
LHSAGSVLLPEFLPAPLNQFVAESPRNALQPRDDLNWGGFANEIQADISRGEPGVYRRAIERLDQLLLDTVLLKTQGNQAAAAELLGLSRPTVRAKLRSVNSRRARPELPGNAAPPPPPTPSHKPDFKLAGNEQEGDREG